MKEETNKIITATNTITTFRKFKGLMLDMLRGYPEYEYFGKFESVFTKTGEKVVEILSKDKLIELSPVKDGETKKYRLTPAGLNLAISMINLDYSEKVIKQSEDVLKYSKEMRWFTIAVIVLTILTLGLGALDFYFQFLK